jgi:predicted porin
MKKSLIALAVMAAAGAASAQSSVQLYGIADVWFGQAKISGTALGESVDWKQTKLDDGGVDSSRWGLKGSEDLGGGLKANFKLEQGFSLDNGGSASGFNRVSTVGLSGNFGAVTLGRDWTAYDDLTGLAKNTLGANISSQNSTWVGYSANPNNTVKFQSNNYAGFSGAVSYSFGEDKGDGQDASDTLSLNVQYANGPLAVGFAHQKTKNMLTATPGIFSTANNLFPNQPEVDGVLDTFDVSGDSTSYNLLTGSYDLGVAKLVGSINRAKFEQYKADEYQIGVDVPLAANLVVSAGYASSKIKEDGEQVGKTRGFSAAVAYNLSKRTTAYAALNNTKATTDELGGIDVKATIYAVGVKHAF